MALFMMILDMLGTIAFAVSGALVGIHRNMDIFGVNVLAVVTATGGGVLRDVLSGTFPPVCFLNLSYIGLAVATANLVFCFFYFHPAFPGWASHPFDLIMFWFDTLGIAAFTVDGVVIGFSRGYGKSLFFVGFLGVITGVGGGILRDILANRMPDVLHKHVYALASMVGAVLATNFISKGEKKMGMLLGFCSVMLLRIMASHFRWNLPRIKADS